MISVILSLSLLLSSSSFVEAAKTSNKCGLPPFVDDLPNSEKKEILSIWKDYKSGDDCADQRRETQKIIDNLTSDVRAVLFGRPPLFLKDAPVSVKKMFRDIMYNRTLKYDEKKQKLSNLAVQILNQKQLAEFRRYLEERERQKKEFEDKVNNLSPAAKEIFHKLERLKAERAEITDVMTDDVRKELRELFRRSKN
ncbi:unnamed protein product [Wuchereria bancrofti]|nr:unnamed protein product [Wuchereria bancrofti]